jgi:hypothetical protein
MPAAEAVRAADLAKTDLEPITDAKWQRVLSSLSVCQFAYAPDDGPVAVATAPGAGDSRGVIKLHGRLVPMTVRYPASPGDGFELFSDDVAVAASTYGGRAGSGAGEAEARLQIGKGLDVGYGGFYGCTQ